MRVLPARPRCLDEIRPPATEFPEGLLEPTRGLFYARKRGLEENHLGKHCFSCFHFVLANWGCSIGSGQLVLAEWVCPIGSDHLGLANRAWPMCSGHFGLARGSRYLGRANWPVWPTWLLAKATDYKSGGFSRKNKQLSRGFCSYDLRKLHRRRKSNF